MLYKGGLLMGSAHMTVGELSSFLMYAFWVGLSIAGAWRAARGCGGRAAWGFWGTDLTSQRLSCSSFRAKAISQAVTPAWLKGKPAAVLRHGVRSASWTPGSGRPRVRGVASHDLLSGCCAPCPPPLSDRGDQTPG